MVSDGGGKWERRIENYRCFHMLKEACLPQLAQHQAENSQELATKNFLIICVQIVIHVSLGVWEPFSRNICHPKRSKFRLFMLIQILIRSVLANTIPRC